MTSGVKVVLVDAASEWRGGQTQLLAVATRGPRPLAVIVRPDAPIRPALEAAGAPVILHAGALGPLLRSLRPDLVAAHDHRGAVRALAGSPVPVVVHRRVDFAPSWLGYRRYRRAAHVVAVSEAVAALLRRGGVERITVVHDGVDPRPFVEARPDPRLAEALGIPTGAPWALAVGALVPHKGHRDLVAALAHLPSWHAVVLGEGPLRARLQRSAQRAGVADRLHLPGFRNDVPSWLASADRFVFPSVQEGLGQAVLEAAFAGAPLVTTWAGGLAELRIGRSVAPADPQALAAAIAAPPVRAEPAQLEPFHVDRMVARTWDVYERVAAR